MNQLSFYPDLSTSLIAGLVAGHVEKVVFLNPITGQCLLDIKAEGLKTHLMLSGFVPEVYPGQSILAQTGVSLQENMRQILTAAEIKIGPPQTERHLKKFLKSKAMSQMAKPLAQALVEAFPKDLFFILSQDPQRLKEAKGIGEKRQEQIMAAWKKFQAQSLFKKFLFQEKLPLEWAETLWFYYGTDSLERFQDNPYALARKHQLSFDLVDAYALTKGFSIESEDRARCALQDLLQNYYKQGHCAYPEKKLLEEAMKKLNCSDEVLQNALEVELVEKRLIEEDIGTTACLYLAEIHRMEKNVAQSLMAFQGRPVPWGWFNLEKVLHWAQSLLNIQLASLQREAIETALASALTVITGGPGTGKTTLVRSFTVILQTQHIRFALCSPTGRAAKRLEEATGHPAQTIHRLLKLNSLSGDFTYNRQNPLAVDLVIVDEISMVDLALMNSLLEALPPHCALILVGDADQIPPVGAGNILQSMIDSKSFTVVRLKEIFRQSEESLIKINAHRINSGEMPLKSELASSDFHYLPVQGVQEAKLMVFDLATRVIPQEYGITNMKEVQILVPLNTGLLGTQRLNQELQQMFSRNTQASEKIIGFEQSFSEGDKVMVIKNDYKKNLFNGDIGFIQRIDHLKQFLDIEFDDRTIRFDFEELDRLTLAYAISIHKSQGSEYRAVIVVITAEHLPLAQRHLIYTAVTRGKEQVFLVAEPQALQTAIFSDENNRRWQKLTELLKLRQ